MKNTFLIIVIILSAIAAKAQKADSTSADTSRYETFNIVEEQPEFPGGEDALMQFLSDNIQYPKAAREKNIQGTVYISFIIEPTGELTHIKILRGIGGGCDEECIRVLKLMPKWKPGKQRGKAVRVQYNLPIKFILEKTPSKSNDKKKKKR